MAKNQGVYTALKSAVRSVVWTLSVIKNCRGNEVAAFAKLSHACMQAYAYTAIDESTSVIALNLEAGFFAVVEYWR